MNKDCERCMYFNKVEECQRENISEETGTCTWFSPAINSDSVRTVAISEPVCIITRNCWICGNSVELRDPWDDRAICEECKEAIQWVKKLKESAEKPVEVLRPDLNTVAGVSFNQTGCIHDTTVSAPRSYCNGCMYLNDVQCKLGMPSKVYKLS